MGFYASVREALKETHGAQLDAGNLIFVPQVQGKPMPDLPDLSSRLSDLASRCTSIRVIFVVLENYEWVADRIHRLVERVRERHPSLEIEVSDPPFNEAGPGAVPALVADIERFGLPAPEAITIGLLESVLGRSRVLCVRSEDTAAFADALIRAGFPADSIGRFFVERTVSSGRNSNLVSMLQESAKTYEYLMYAWDKLRTLDAKSKKRFSGRAYEGQTVAKVIGILKRWVIAESEKNREPPEE